MTVPHERIRPALPARGGNEQLTRARRVLRENLIRTRDVLNGRDFLFSGSRDILRPALESLRDLERREGDLHLDFVETSDFFLLRLTGRNEHQEKILSYFE